MNNVSYLAYLAFEQKKRRERYVRQPAQDRKRR